MTFVQLKYILTIAETKSLNKAAEQLYVSQPSLTNALKELEKEVGITIFFRTGRGVTLTNDGVEFLACPPPPKKTATLLTSTLPLERRDTLNDCVSSS